MCLTTQMIQKLIYIASLFFPGIALQADAQKGVMSHCFRIWAEHRTLCMFYVEKFSICIASLDTYTILSDLKHLMHSLQI